MKKFFGNFLILLSILLVSVAAVPWNNISQWGVAIPVLENYEIYIKGGIGALVIIIGLVYMLIANNEYRNYGHVSQNTARVAFIPMYIFAIAMLVFGGLINYHVYSLNPNTINLLVLGFFGIVALNMIIFGHLFLGTFKKESNGRRIAHFVLIIELMAIASYLSYWFFTFKLTAAEYGNFGTYYFILIVAVAVVLYIVHIIISSVSKKRNEELDELESEIDDISNTNKQPSKDNLKSRRTKKKDTHKHEVVNRSDDKKTMIVSNQQTIVSSEQNIDPTNMIYEDVDVDPEFTKTSPAANQPNSIEYYIEKPKMFKSLDPTFDQLVAYVRELPQVVTKLDEGKITFYVDRKPFLVLMNFGNYYRVAFKYDLEKGIRLIIKYPTISKNKSTREELWFKANNYGDIPKDVVYQIVKSSYDNINA
jgi:predicted DNA-binding protein (MmcQ/YjbR family)